MCIELNSTVSPIFHMGDEVLASAMAAAVLFPASVAEIKQILSYFFLRAFFSFHFFNSNFRGFVYIILYITFFKEQLKCF